jgi:hypothetical protein
MPRKTAQQRIEELEREVSEWKERADRAWAIVYNMVIPEVPKIESHSSWQPPTEEEQLAAKKREIQQWTELLWEIAPKLAESMGLKKPEVELQITGKEDEEQKKKKKKDSDAQGKLET